MEKFLSEKQERDLEKKKAGIDFLLDLLGGTEEGPIDFKLMKAHRDLSNAMNNLISKSDFTDMDDEPKKAVLNILKQATEVINDITKSQEEI